MAKAQVGDLIRITNVPKGGQGSSVGDIFEVIKRFEPGSRSHENGGVEFVHSEMLVGAVGCYVYDDQYEIHCKAGEEDAANPTQLEPSKWSDTQENLIRLACSELADLLVRKNHDYGDSFSQQYDKYGLMSALIRMDDKMRRLETLRGGEQAQVAESVGDTLQDLAGYALLAYVESKKK
ncbi:nucleotide modification associated domain-containing protein [Lysinibacillus sp. NPDC093712]|uniref:nucleotide modification associated domain-containing protein n=1 Tax=Lysinibacillus sp. NPDC093712 TaxID=3390579 RepID=UPI003D03F6F2